LSLRAENAERQRAEDALRRSETQLRRQLEQLDIANKELEAFAYSISHDLRAPLRAMNGFTNILLAQPGSRQDDEAAHCLRMIRDGALQMDRLLDGLLELSRLHHRPLHKEPVAMGALIKESLSHHREALAQRNIDIEIEELESAHGDAPLLLQVWINLIGNALKYTRQCERARITIGCDLRDGATVYYVKDNGAGFDMRYAGKLFGVFQRLHAHGEYEGTGIGLAIVRRIVERHGGRVWAEAEKKRGAAFYFTLEGARA
jgi:light-regulated signal transduction histidine kinase (bacteriophytochrome)